MILRYFYDDKLAHASYLVGCAATGEALVVDPGRDIDPYLAVADREGLNVSAVTETHIHADFVSGARELAERAGATLYLSDEGDENWKYSYADVYDHVFLKDGDIVRVGNVELRAVHTPGHTPEHLSFLLTDAAGADQPMGIFTGDFVFVGDVGRPDLLETAAGVAGAMEPSARELFRSLQSFKSAPDFLQIWPAHGAGSACGRSLGAVPSSTVGYEKLFNWAFQIQDEDEFLAEVLRDQPEPPRYFAVMKRVNKEGPPVLHGLPLPGRLPARRLPAVLEAGALVIDTRDFSAYATAHVPGTLNIPLHYDFNTWAGWLVSYDEPFYLIVADDHVDEAVKALLAIGLDNLAGYFTLDAIEAWELAGRAVARVPQVDVHSLSEMLRRDQVVVIDVRGVSEYREVHIPDVVNIPLGYLPDRLADVPRGSHIAVHCGSGNRSAIAASVLQRLGIRDVMNLRGGIDEWRRAGYPVTSEPEPA